jgi:hypothetical protein
MEPRFKIIGNEVKGDGKTYTASPELKERFGDNEFGEKDFEVRKEERHPDCQKFGCQKEEHEGHPVCDYACENVREVAYPVSQEQESQAVSEVSEFLELWDMATTMHRREFMKEAKKHYTITKNK